MEKTETDPVTGCLLWQGAKTGCYGQISVDGVLRPATHVAVELVTGQPVSAGSWVRPSCGTPACVAFDHLTVEAAHGAGGQRKKRPPLERLYAKSVRVPETGCRLWTGAIDLHGYGLFYLDGKLMGAHRAAFILDNGQPIPPDRLVRHNCDTPNCIEPSHLRLGTQAENKQDRADRGRSERGHTLLPELRASDRAIMLTTKAVGFSAAEIAGGWALSPSATTQALAKARREGAAEQAKAT